MAEAIPAFYTRDEKAYIATGLGISPWNKQAQMGVALAGLAAHCLEAVPSPVSMQTARLSIDIMGGVPPVPLTPITRVVREGRSVQLVELDLVAEDHCWLKASALRLRTRATPEASVPPSLAFPPEGYDPKGPGLKWADTILLHGGFHQVGPGALWTRFTSTVVAGEPLRPLEALAMLADFGSGIAPILPTKQWSQANVDITLQITGMPRSEWLLIDASSESAGNGYGVVHSRISDTDGALGMAHQTVFLNPL